MIKHTIHRRWHRNFIFMSMRGLLRSNILASNMTCVSLENDKTARSAILYLVFLMKIESNFI